MAHKSKHNRPSNSTPNQAPTARASKQSESSLAPAKDIPATPGPNDEAAPAPVAQADQPAPTEEKPAFQKSVAGPVADKLSALLASARTPIPEMALVETVKQAPQTLKSYGEKAVAQFNKLSTTQKVVGGALLAGGISWLALRAKSPAAAGVNKTPHQGKSASKLAIKKGKKAYRGAK